MNSLNDPQGRIGWIDKFLSRKDYVGVTIVLLVLAVIALFAQVIYKDHRIDTILADCAQERRVFAKETQSREDTIRAEAKREAAALYKQAFKDSDARIASLEATIDKLLNKSTAVSTKYDQFETQIKTVSDNQKKIEQIIPRR